MTGVNIVMSKIFSEFLQQIEDAKRRIGIVTVYDANGPLYFGRLVAWNPQNLTIVLEDALNIKENKEIPKVVVRGDIVKRVEFEGWRRTEKYVKGSSID